jgi:3(or 17)beta-hydroxysteroid dehydrogenase
MQGDVALVTGGASGVGRATAELLAGRGARVIIADVDAASGPGVAAEIGPEVRFFRLDVGDEKNWAEAMRFAEDLGGLRFLANNAGVSSMFDITQVGADEWLRVFRVNVLGVYLGCKYGLEAMKERGGAIVNTSSTASILPQPDIPIYAASKSAVNGLTRSIAGFCLQKGLPVRCNAVLPGGMRTKMAREAYLSQGVDMESDTPQGQALREIFVDR